MGGAASTHKPPFGAKTPAQAVVEHYKERAAGKTFLITVRGLGSARRPRPRVRDAVALAVLRQRVSRWPWRRFRACSDLEDGAL